MLRRIVNIHIVLPWHYYLTKNLHLLPLPAKIQGTAVQLQLLLLP